MNALSSGLAAKGGSGGEPGGKGGGVPARPSHPVPALYRPVRSSATGRAGRPQGRKWHLDPSSSFDFLDGGNGTELSEFTDPSN